MGLAGGHACAPISHSCIILRICKHHVRAELTEGYQRKWPSEDSPGAIFMPFPNGLSTSLITNSCGRGMQNDIVLTGNFAFKRLEP